LYKNLCDRTADEKEYRR